MEEIEVKVLEVPAERVIARLVSLGARQDVDVRMHALYFDTPTRELTGRGDSLRLRREGTRVLLNHKAHRPGGSLKIKEEHETAVGGLDEARRILEGLGYVVWFEMEKHRRGWVLDGLPGTHFVFDRFLGAHRNVPELLEIEAPTREALEEGLRVAGYTLDQTVAWNGFEVVEHYGTPGPRTPSRD